LVALEIAAGIYVHEDDLYTRYGDPTVLFMPKGWAGEDCKGRRYSECPPEFLDHLAGALRSMSERAPKDGKDFRDKNRREAAMARTWARVLRRRAAANAVRAAREANGVVRVLTEDDLIPDQDLIP